MVVNPHLSRHAFSLSRASSICCSCHRGLIFGSVAGLGDQIRVTPDATYILLQVEAISTWHESRVNMHGRRSYSCNAGKLNIDSLFVRSVVTLGLMRIEKPQLVTTW